jgi:cytochrome c peroxidase
MKRSRPIAAEGVRRIAAPAAGVLFACIALAAAQTNTPTFDTPPPPSLKTVPVPEPSNLSDFIADRQAAIQLGKALFWDMQVGSDGVTACATCHFHAGADSRVANQLSPGLLRRDPNAQLTPDRQFDNGHAPNARLTADLFPLRKLLDESERASAAVRDSNDVVSSQGVFNSRFAGIIPGSAEERVTRSADPDGFRAGTPPLNVRRVEPRHTPTVINAVFNSRNFWDGRAQNEFNGVNEWGDRDPDAFVFKSGKGNRLERVRVRLQNASLASQAVAPILSAVEMSADGRIGADIGNKLGKQRGKKLNKMRPLAGQVVHPQDSVLGSLSRSPKPGLNVPNYEWLIQKAFKSEWWQSNEVISVADDGTVSVLKNPDRDLATTEYTLMQYNFPLFFGLAIQLYEATLVSDDTPYDRWREGRGTLSPEALVGLEVFLGQAEKTLPDGTRRAGARCINCHGGSEFTDASVSSVAKNTETRNREGQDLDRGWNNIGVRPWMDDLAVGGRDPFGVWLSVTRLRPKSDRYIAVDGAFKAPGLRNVELTAPYFHNGGYLTLESLVDFYSRGGDFAPLRGVNGEEIAPLSVPAMSAAEKAGVVAFLKALTDERVRDRRAPFDHPQLFVPDGQQDDEFNTQEDTARAGQAQDRMLEIAAVGRNGGPALPTFAENLAPANTPKPFAFQPATGVSTGAEAISQPIVLSGIATTAPLSISGGRYSINGGAFSSSSRTVASGDTIRVLLPASRNLNTRTCATVTIGALSRPFCATTTALSFNVEQLLPFWYGD